MTCVKLLKPASLL